MPYYLAVAAVYGTLAYLTNSIWPSVVLHAGGNMFVALDFFARGQSEWQASSNVFSVSQRLCGLFVDCVFASGQ